MNNTLRSAKNVKFDDYVTPESAWKSIKDFIPKNQVLWEPFYCDGKSGEILTKLGFEVIHENEDFFENNKGDIIVSNPPFSIKKQVLIKMKELNKPFLLLMPLDTLSRVYFSKLKFDNIQIIIPNKRIQFHKFVNGEYVTKNAACFDCAFFCWKLNLNKDITFL